jgi:hypothetical protein
MPRGGFLRFGQLCVVVTGDKASRGRPRKGMTTADIVTGNPAHDGASDASLGENGCSGRGTGDQSNSESDFTEHAVFLDEVYCKRNSPHDGCKSHGLAASFDLPRFHHSAELNGAVASGATRNQTVRRKGRLCRPLARRGAPDR